LSYSPCQTVQSHAEYTAELCKEIAARGQQVTGYTVNTVFFGGGTPSFIDAKYIAKLLEAVRESFSVAPDAEISIECNPNSLTREKLAVYKAAGINRVSIGVQSFKNKTLQVLGRVHNVKQAKNAIKLAREFFENLSIDLIHSVPRCKTKIPRRFLKLIHHVSAYCLTSDKYVSVADGKSIKEQQWIEKVLCKHDIQKYEVSNFARPGFECKHNLNYWQCGQWLGFGTGAESHFNEPWSGSDRIMLGLRMAKGVPFELVVHKKDEVDCMVTLGLLRYARNDTEAEYVACTQKGFLILNQILCKLTADD